MYRVFFYIWYKFLSHSENNTFFTLHCFYIKVDWRAQYRKTLCNFKSNLFFRMILQRILTCPFFNSNKQNYGIIATINSKHVNYTISILSPSFSNETVKKLQLLKITTNFSVIYTLKTLKNQILLMLDVRVSLLIFF